MIFSTAGGPSPASSPKRSAPDVKKAHSRLTLALVSQVVEQHGQEAGAGLDALANVEQHDAQDDGRQRSSRQPPVVGKELADQGGTDSREFFARSLGGLFGRGEELFPEHEVTDDQRKQRGKQQTGHHGIEQPQPSAGIWGHVDELVPPQPEDDRGYPHQHAGNAERDFRIAVAEQQRSQDGRKKRAEVDDEIKGLVDLGDQVRIGGRELVADVGRYAWLDAAGADRDQSQPDIHRDFGRGELADRPQPTRDRQNGVAGAIDQRHPQDGPVFAQQPIGDDRADQRKCVHARHEEVHHLGAAGFRFGHRLRVNGRLVHELHEQGDHVDLQDRLHSVEAEPLGTLVADDVRNAGGHLDRARIFGRSKISLVDGRAR